jgi:hypothetical protein
MDQQYAKQYDLLKKKDEITTELRQKSEFLDLKNAEMNKDCGISVSLRDTLK